MSERPFYGWVVLAAAFAIITMSIGTLFTLGVFLAPIEQSMGWSRSGIGAISLFNWIVMGAGGLVAGYVSDRWGTRRVVLTGAVLLTLGLVLSSFVREIWHLYATFGLLVGAGVSTFYVPLTVLAVRWFDGRRGMAAAVVSAGNGLGLLALAPLTRWLISAFDWRVAFLVLGNLALVVVVPCALLLKSPSAAGARKWPPHSPSGGQSSGGHSSGVPALVPTLSAGPPHSPSGGQPSASLPEGPSAAGARKWPPHSPSGGQSSASLPEGPSAAGAQKWPPHSPSGGQSSGGRSSGVQTFVSTLSTAPVLSAVPALPAGSPWGTWAFWAIALTHFCCCAAHSGPLFHLVSHALDQGVDKMAAASILGASGLTSILGRVGTGMVADRVGSKRTLLTALGLQALVIFLYLFAGSAETLYALSLAFGVAYGSAMPLYALVTRDYFGERVMGTAYGAVFFISCIGMGIGSYAGGAIHDLVGTYQWLFLGSSAIALMAVVLGVTLRPPAAASVVRPSPALGGSSPVSR